MTRVQVVIFRDGQQALRIIRTEGDADVVVWYVEEDAELLSQVTVPEWLADPNTLLLDGYELGLRSERY